MTDRAMRRLPRSRQAHPIGSWTAPAASEPNVRSNPRFRIGPFDTRRIGAAALSAVFPGLGQAFNRRRRLALGFLVPTLAISAVTALVAMTTAPQVLLARAIEPGVLAALLTANLVLLVWRLAAVAQAFLDPRRATRTSPVTLIALIAIVFVTAAPHAIAKSWGETAQATFARVFQTPTHRIAAGSADGRLDRRINVLIVGIDKTKWRTATLTDSMMVASLDPVGKTVALVSIPRDLVNVPLGNGSDFGPKLNSLMSYADRHKDQFPDGGMAALESAVGALLGIRIDYYARLDFVGFIAMIDAVGGVDIDVEHGFTDPLYDGYGLAGRGYTITPGRHHFDGVNALAYARSRQAMGESDFKRAERQQEVLVALRDKLMTGGSLFWQVPTLLAALGDLVTTDVPVDLLPMAAAVLDEMGAGGITRVVIRQPLVHSGRNQYGSIQIPDLRRIRAVAARLFTEPGVPPTPWPTPRPSPAIRPSGSGG